MSVQQNPLRNIRRFDQFVVYLRDELDWPIESDDFDDITFDYEPEELGLDAKTAAKIQQIKQLRPLSSSQPWGVFWVKFDPKRLPVVALRRILSRLALKKRASANKSERAGWDLHDLLFISSYGEAENRQISLAHFSVDGEIGDLPTLRVLGWDGDDTQLKLDHVQHEMQARLRWPDDEENVEEWRSQWAAAFTLRHREVITTSQQLAVRLAELAKSIRRKVNAAIEVESQKGPLRKLMKAFQQALIHDLEQDDFADMYAQTIAYGLLSARVSRASGALVADDMAQLVPITNPFLRELMETFLHLGGRKKTGTINGGFDFDELGINDVVESLRRANMEAVLRDFDNRNPQEDPVVHFYEVFLKEYDARKRMQRGVFYTPKPVVSYIVRSVHELLQNEFGLENGLADTATWGEMIERNADMKLPEIDVLNLTTNEFEKKPIDPDTPFVNILDPATGTATFLVEVLDVIFRTMTDKWTQQGLSKQQQKVAWNDYVPKHLLPRLHGYELMMAPYAIAHMKLGLKLAETGYRFASDERARIYLTNALEPPAAKEQQLTFADWSPALAHEVQAVNDVKRRQRFTVVIGNPPYSYMTANLTDAAGKLIERFRFVDSNRIREKSALSLERSLQDDFVKFFGLSIELARQTRTAFVLGMITNNSYMDSALHRGVRGQLVNNFGLIYLVNLFGDSIKDREENVFDIQQGVAVFLGVNRHSSPCAVFVNDIKGSRAEKYAKLTRLTWRKMQYTRIELTAPQRYFLRLEKRGEYLLFPSLADAFQLTSTCIKTLKDDLATAFDGGELREKLIFFRDSANSKEQVMQRFGVKDVVQWKIDPARSAIRDLTLDDYFEQYQARPFDFRWMFYHRAIVGSPRAQVMRNLLRTKNRALISNRKVRSRAIITYRIGIDVPAEFFA